MHTDPQDFLPDVHDGLTRRERVVLQCLYELQMFEATPENVINKERSGLGSPPSVTA